MYDLQFPIGEFNAPSNVSNQEINDWILTIESFPEGLRATCQNLNAQQLDWRYRPDGWTIRQVVNHCADSHMNSLLRFKLALTETEPEIRPYLEDKWAELADYKQPIENTMALISALHHKWVFLLKSLTADQLKFEFVHPEHGKRFQLDENIGVYAWHCEHHLAHINMALRAKGEFN
jgi:hypothetical protein